MKMPIPFICVFALLINPLLATGSCTANDPEFLITFHPHLDAFWLNTDTQLKDINFRPAGFLYAMNQRNSKTVFNSMLDSLSQKKIRKYFVTQSVFFKDWYDYLPAEKQQRVKQLLQSGQLQIANGGWVENDEAVCYYDDILDQYTLGMNFLDEKLDYQVKIGWATDSFGHSHSQVALEHLLGIQFQGIQRVDERYVNEHKNKPLLQFYWPAVSDSNNLTYGGVLNHVRHFLHEVNDLRDPNPISLKNDFVKIQKHMREYYGKNKMFRFLGNDFEQFIPIEFQNLQKMMSDLNGNAECGQFKYGNPSDYLQLITEYYSKQSLPIRQQDFMPNWDQDRYWSGYFTTDPLLKKTCKDFSRLVNFYRKSLLHLQAHSQNSNILTIAEQLLAVVQHHDGITATSKTYIEDEFRRRMQSSTASLMNSLEHIHNATDVITCKFYQDQNQCQLPFGKELKRLDILAHGAPRKQKIQLITTLDSLYEITEAEEQVFCDGDICSIVFEANIRPGLNKFTLTFQDKLRMQSKTYNLTQSPNSQIELTQQNKAIKYSFGEGEFFQFSFWTSQNNQNNSETKSWDKFGEKKDKNQRISAGMYIMFNNGRLDATLNHFTLKSAKGKIYSRFAADSSSSKFRLTIKNEEPNVVDAKHTFKPTTGAMQDYFLKVSSNIASNTLYHDSNGFLVAKREPQVRSDYDFVPNSRDIINANTYPVTSFAYLLKNNKKMLFFSDRAQGVAPYNESLLINFDRLAMDDGKGAGQSFSKIVNNTFRYKFAQISAENDLERLWQREYDESLIGYLVNNQQSNILYAKNGNTPIEGGNLRKQQTANNLKYTIFWLNNNQYVLRLQNLAEFSNLSVNKYIKNGQKYNWKIKQLGIDLQFKDIKQSYANGIVKQKSSQKWRKYWSKQNNQVNTINITMNDNNLNLRPLQIVSFRINIDNKIVQKPNRLVQKNPVLSALTNVREIKRLRKRCF